MLPDSQRDYSSFELLVPHRPRPGAQTWRLQLCTRELKKASNIKEKKNETKHNFIDCNIIHQLFSSQSTKIMRKKIHSQKKSIFSAIFVSWYRFSMYTCRHNKLNATLESSHLFCQQILT